MKTKNVRLRLKDMHTGRIVYVSHPKHGIECFKIVGKPYKLSLGLFEKSLFINTLHCSPLIGKWVKHNRSLRDMGVMDGGTYNYRRTFSTLEQAEKYAEQTKHCAHFQKHEAECEQFFSDMFD